MLFDWLITGQVVPFNPAAAVRGPKHVVTTGKTPVLDGTEWRKLIDSIPVDTKRDLRDRALIATLTYSFARIGAAQMKVEDLQSFNPKDRAGSFYARTPPKREIGKLLLINVRGTCRHLGGQAPHGRRRCRTRR